jgi:hypothetical protein
MAEIIKEVTVWNSDFQTNHTYLLNSKGALIAYAKFSGDEVVVSKSKTIKLDKRYRKFVKVNHSGLQKILETLKEEKEEYVKPKDVRAFKVNSNGKDYIVEVSAANKMSCNCIGFGFHRKCKHIAAVAEKQHLLK